jgi:LDH2 family malate/lactate/ureidoglycolate dehydrogenase
MNQTIENKKIDVETLKEYCIKALTLVGVSQEHAALTTEVLVTTDLMGINSHGVVRLIPYIKRLKTGLINPKPKIEVNEPAPAVRIIDGDHGLGAVVAMTGVREAIKVAQKYGIGFATCRNSNHMGAGAPYVLEACMQGVMLMGGTNAFPTMAPVRGKEIMIGNNPIFFGIPRKNAPHFILDIAMSAAARGKIREAQKHDEKIPSGWALDSAGNPTQDPEAGLKGYVLPIAEHKGYGMALAIDMFAGILSGSGFGKGVLSLFQQWEKPQFIGHFFTVIEPGFFMPKEEFYQRCDSLLDQIKTSEPWDSNRPVLYPGEIEAAKSQKNLEEGLVLNQKDWKAIESFAQGNYDIEVAKA